MSKITPKKYSALGHWGICHCRALMFALGSLFRTPMAMLMTLLVIAIATALPTSLYLLLKNVQAISSQWHGSPSISLYLKTAITPATAQQLVTQLEQQPGVAKVTYISPAQGLKTFSRLTSIDNVLNALQQNPLPPVLVVTPSISQQQSQQALQQLLMSLKQLPQVSIGQLDMSWVKRLFYIVTLGERITYSLGFVLALGVLLIITNTIRLKTQSHRQSINVLKLVGATAAFIRRPLLYRGFLLGLFSGILALGLVSALLWWLEVPAQALAQTYDNNLVLQGLTWSSCLSIISVTSLLGLIGSWWTTRQYLRAAEGV